MLPIDIVWEFLFCKYLSALHSKKIAIVGVVGGSGKTTLAKQISRFYGHHHIPIDDCKYGENWKRYTADEFEENVDNEIAKANRGKYVIEGVFYDEKLAKQSEKLTQLINDDDGADLIIWHDVPRWVAMWRKLYRSLKRFIKVESLGTAPEKWHNVKEMVKKGWNRYDDRYQKLDKFWNVHNNNDGNNRNNNTKFQRLQWPYYYSIFTTSKA